MHIEKWRRYLENHAQDLVLRAEYTPEFGPSVIPSVDLGILFVMAVWSGTSQLSIRKLNEVLPPADPDQQCRLFIAASDRLKGLLKIPELKGKLGGNGEIAWIHMGKIVATTGSRFNPDLIGWNTQYLMSLSTAS
ncbi:MAG: hypothetical protein KDA52_03210 [Planctomycetaceae bacterium]|nr:hypothetical protein [Planctomycetaceae bacterium]